MLDSQSDWCSGFTPNLTLGRIVIFNLAEIVQPPIAQVSTFARPACLFVGSNPVLLLGRRSIPCPPTPLDDVSIYNGYTHCFGWALPIPLALRHVYIGYVNCIG